MNSCRTMLVFCLLLTLMGCGDANDLTHIAVTDIALNTHAIALKIGGTETLSVTLLPANATEQSLLWSSDDATVATVDRHSGLVKACGLGQTTIRVVPAAGGALEESCTVTVLTTEPYVVGDLYPDATSPQGIVFWMNPSNPTQGKILSLDQTRKPWATNGVTTRAQDGDDGQMNMTVVTTFDHWTSDFPAFAWCAAKGEGWYLPALNELIQVYEAKEELDEVIARNGDLPLSAGDYWSSTERKQNSTTTAVTVTFRSVTDNESWASKDGTNYVRAIKRF